ncbi:MAG: transposase [Leptospiraceae bacterium]|nr:transposase [Leptospiraceae bacterium]
MYQLESRKKLDEFKNRKFENHKFFAVFIDGTNVGGQSIVTALGVDIEGNKHFLGFSEGSTENYEITKELLVSFRERGLKFTDKVIFILDGSGSLKKAIKEQFGDSAVIQRCTNHKLWNLLAKLPEKHHEECKLRYRRIFSCNEYSDAKEEYLGFETWLSRISYSASNSLKEAEYDLLTIHKIRMPVEMRKTFLTTNTIESGFSGPKSLMKRVKKWNLGTDMISRWVSVNLLYQEKRFRKINGVNKINIFLADFLEQQLDKKVAA